MKKIIMLTFLIAVLFSNKSALAQSMPPTVVNLQLEQVSENQISMSYAFMNDNTFPIHMRVQLGTLPSQGNVIDTTYDEPSPGGRQLVMDVSTVTTTTMLYLTLTMWNSVATTVKSDSVEFTPLTNAILQPSALPTVTIVGKGLKVAVATDESLSVTIQVFDMVGQEQKSVMIRHQSESIEIPDLVTGYYLVTGVSKGAIILKKRVFIE